MPLIIVSKVENAIIIIILLKQSKQRVKKKIIYLLMNTQIHLELLVQNIYLSKLDFFKIPRMLQNQNEK